MTKPGSMTTATGWRPAEGNPETTALRQGRTLIYVPVVKHPRDFAFTFGPLGYEKVQAVEECPFAVVPGPRRKFYPVNITENEPRH